MAMTPWAYTDDYSIQFNVARGLLGETNPETARIPDQAITSAIATFGYQRGVAMLAQRLMVEISQEVIRYQEQGGSGTQWSESRVNSLKAVKAAGDAGTLPDPAVSTTELAASSLWMQNEPVW